MSGLLQGTQETQKINREYDTPEAVLVTLMVTDDEGATNTATLTIVVFHTIRPEAEFSHEPEGGTIHDTVAFFDESRDEDGSILSWEWDFGDGDTSSRKDPTHTFENKGTHRVTITMEDDDGNTDTVTQSVTIENLPSPQQSSPPPPPRPRWMPLSGSSMPSQTPRTTSSGTPGTLGTGALPTLPTRATDTTRQDPTQ